MSISALFALEPFSREQVGRSGYTESEKAGFGYFDKAVYQLRPRFKDEIVVSEVAEVSRAFADDWVAVTNWLHHKELMTLSLNNQSTQQLSETFAKFADVVYFAGHGVVADSVVAAFDSLWGQRPAHQENTAITQGDEHVDQARLGLSEYFAPSVEAVTIWTEGLRELAIGAGRQNVDLALAAASAQERAHEFATMFRAAIGSFAQYARYEGGDRVLVSGGRFSPNFQRALYQQFELVPDRSLDFFKALVSDFLRALHSGWRVQGDWGSVRSLGGEVTLALRPVEYFQDPDFVESEDVE